MALKYCLVERQGHITTVTVNRPEALNALPLDAHDEFSGVFDAIEADPEQWIAIVTGAGDRAFCAGNDLKGSIGDAIGDAIRRGFAGLTSRLHRTKPVIAAVNGVAMGGGFELALACDIIIADERAKFALPEPRVGLVALGGGALRLAHVIGEKQALGMILTGRTVSAAEGKALGFVNEVVPPGEALAAAMRWALQIAEASPLAVRASRDLVRIGLEKPLGEAIGEQMELPSVQALFRSTDIVEGPLAFTEKRLPAWASA